VLSIASPFTIARDRLNHMLPLKSRPVMLVILCSNPTARRRKRPVLFAKIFREATTVHHGPEQQQLKIMPWSETNDGPQ
jgi:hypothetical protein